MCSHLGYKTASIRWGISWWETVQLDWLILRPVVTWHLLDSPSFPFPFPLCLFACLVTVLNVYLCFDLKSIAVWGVALITPVRLPIVQFVPVTRINTKYILYLVYTALHHKVLCGLSKCAFNTLPQRKRKELCSLSLVFVGFKSSFRCCLAPPLAGDRNRNLLLMLLLLLQVPSLVDCDAFWQYGLCILWGGAKLQR